MQDFDTNSVLQINCNNTHRFSLPYGFAASDYRKEKMKKSVKMHFSAKTEISGCLKNSQLFHGLQN